jgi:hypothetical protein
VEDHSSVSRENKGKGVFGFFEKGILKLEPGNDPNQKPAPSPKVSHKFSTTFLPSNKLHDSHDAIRDEGYRGVGVHKALNFPDSPRKSPVRDKTKLNVADLIHGSTKHLSNSNFDEPTKESQKKLLNHYFDSPPPMSPVRQKPNVFHDNASHRGNG